MPGIQNPQQLRHRRSNGVLSMDFAVEPCRFTVANKTGEETTYRMAALAQSRERMFISIQIASFMSEGHPLFLRGTLLCSSRKSILNHGELIEYGLPVPLLRLLGQRATRRTRSRSCKTGVTVVERSLAGTTWSHFSRHRRRRG